MVLQPVSKIQQAHTPNQAPWDTQREGQRRSMGIAEPSMQKISFLSNTNRIPAERDPKRTVAKQSVSRQVILCELDLETVRETRSHPTLIFLYGFVVRHSRT